MKNTSTEPNGPATGESTSAPAPTITEQVTNTPEQAPLESGYITFSGPGEGGEFRDPDGGYRIHLIRDLPVAFGSEARVTAAYAHKLVQDGQAIYTDKPSVLSNAPTVN